MTNADHAAFVPRGDELLQVTAAEMREASAVWVDVAKPSPAREAMLLAELDQEADDDVIERFCAPDSHLTRGVLHQRGSAVWAFGMTPTDSRGETFSVDLQPVRFLVAGHAVLTTRLAGTRYSIDPPRRSMPDAAFAVTLGRLRERAAQEWRAKRAEDPGDRDLLLLVLLRALVTSLFEGRAELAQRRTRIDFQFFEDLAAMRAEAAAADTPTGARVSELAQHGSALVDLARLRLNEIHTVAAELREWFDDLKPAGRDDPRIWLPETVRTEAAVGLVNRIYQVRNDLGSLRRDVHGSMALLATADTGGQLLAIRALLDRTESARRAGVVAAALTLLLATVVLIAAIAAIPASGAHFSVGRAAALSGLIVVAAIAVGALVALATTSFSGWRGAANVAVACASASVAVFVLALVGPGGARAGLVAAGTGLGTIALIAAAAAGDFGSTAIPPEVAAARRLLAHRDLWTGDAAALYRELRRAARLQRWERTWPRTAEGLVDRLQQEQLALKREQIEFCVSADTASVTLRRLPPDAAR